MDLIIPPKRHRFPLAIISQSVWLYHRFNHSLRDVSYSQKLCMKPQAAFITS